MPKMDTATFALEVFDGSEKQQIRLDQFLTVYHKKFDKFETNPAELKSFLLNPGPNRQIRYLGLTENGHPCGFATLMIYPELDFAAIDHIAIARESSDDKALKVFCKMIKDYYVQNVRDVRFVIAEIMLDEQPIKIKSRPFKLMHYFGRYKFRISNLKYYAPDPQNIKNRNLCRAALLVASSDQITTMAAHDFIKLLRAIFFSHYADWYREVQRAHEFIDYEQQIVAVFNEMKEAVKAKGQIEFRKLSEVDIGFFTEHETSQNASATVPGRSELDRRSIDSDDRASFWINIGPLFWTLPIVVVLPIMAYIFVYVGLLGSLVVFFFLLLIYGALGAATLRSRKAIEDKTFLAIFSLAFSTSLKGVKALRQKNIK